MHVRLLGPCYKTGEWRPFTPATPARLDKSSVHSDGTPDPTSRDTITSHNESSKALPQTPTATQFCARFHFKTSIRFPWREKGGFYFGRGYNMLWQDPDKGTQTTTPPYPHQHRPSKLRILAGQTHSGTRPAGHLNRTSLSWRPH